MEDPLFVDRKGRFANRHAPKIRRRPTDFALWMLGFFRDQPFELVPEGFSYPIPEKKFDPQQPWAMWIGHSTYLVSIGGKHILTDPIWSKRCSPVPLCGPKRRTLPAMPLEALPEIDYVLISHDHYDHLDRPTVERLHRRFPEILWVVPKGLKRWFLRLGIKKIVELSWWEDVHVDSVFKVSAVPSQHYSGRTSTHVNASLWGGYVVEDLVHSKTLYFVGDTGYNEQDFKEIGKRFPEIDLSLIPIGSYSPRKFMAPVHLEPADAVNLHLDVNSKLSLGMHWKTFRLSEEPMEQPPFDLYCAMKEKELDLSTFLAIDPGHKVNW